MVAVPRLLDFESQLNLFYCEDLGSIFRPNFCNVILDYTLYIPKDVILMFGLHFPSHPIPPVNQTG
jgi:hypothetical protein